VPERDRRPRDHRGLRELCLRVDGDRKSSVHSSVKQVLRIGDSAIAVLKRREGVVVAKMAEIRAPLKRVLLWDMVNPVPAEIVFCGPPLRTLPMLQIVGMYPGKTMGLPSSVALRFAN